MVRARGLKADCLSKMALYLFNLKHNEPTRLHPVGNVTSIRTARPTLEFIHCLRTRVLRAYINTSGSSVGKEEVIRH